MDTEHKIAIVIDANGKSAIGVFDATTNSMIRTLDASEVLNRSAKAGGAEVDKSAAKWQKFGGLVGTAIGSIVGGAAALITRAIGMADAAGKLADKLGTTTEFISEMGYVAKSAGSDAKKLESGLYGLSDSMAKAAEGAKKPSAAFRSLGIDVRDSHGNLKSLDQLLPELADKFARMSDGPLKGAVAVALLGSAGHDLLPVLSKGSEGIARLRQEAVELGASIGGDTSKQAGEFRDRLDALVNLSLALANSAIRPLLPLLNTLAQMFVQDATESAKAIQQTSIFTNALKAMAIATAITRGAIQALVNILATGWDMAIKGAQHGAGLVTETWSGVWDTIGAAWDGDMDGAVNAFAASRDRIAKLSKDGVTTIGGLWANMTNGIAVAGEEAAGIIDRILNPAIAGTGAAAADALPPIDGLGEGYLGLGDDASEAERRAKELRDRIGEVAEEALSLREDVSALKDELSGPTAQANAQYQAQLERINKLVFEGAVSVKDATGMQAVFREALDDTKGTTADLIKEMEFERSLIGLSNIDREVAIALRQLEKGATVEQRDAVAELVREIAEESKAHEELQRIGEGAFTSLTAVAGDYFTGLTDGAGDAWDQVKSITRRALSDVISMMLQSGLKNVFASLLSGGGGGGGGFLSTIGSLFGGGGGGGAAGGGFNLSSITSLFGGGGTGGGGMLQSLGSMFGFGGGSAAALGASAAASYGVLSPAVTSTLGSYGVAATANGVGTLSSAGIGTAGGTLGWVPVVGWIMAAMGLNQSLFKQGWQYDSSTIRSPLPNAIDPIGRSDNMLQSLGLSASMASLLSGSAIHQRLWGRKKPELRYMDTSYDFSEEGLSGSATAQTVARGGVFRSDKWERITEDLDEESLDAIRSVFEGIRAGLKEGASQLGIAAPDMIAASLRVSETYDKKGEVTATKYIVDMLGKSWEEATAEAATARIGAENLIGLVDSWLGGATSAIGAAVVDPILDGLDAAGPGFRDRIGEVLEKAMPTDTFGWGDETADTPIDARSPNAGPGEASRIAERWRDDAELLMDGAQMLLASATDIRAGIGLLRDEGGLTEITELVEDLQHSGESLTETYARIAGGAQLLDEVFAITGTQIGRTRDSFVRWTDGVVEAAGGLDRATALVRDFETRYLTATERAQYALTRVTAGGKEEFADIGLEMGDFTGDGGMQALREIFEQKLPTLSADAAVQWFEALSALGLVLDATQALADAAGQTKDQLANIKNVLDSNAWELMAAGMTTADRALREIDLTFDAYRQTLIANHATVEQLTQLEEQHTQALEQQAAAMRKQISDILGGNAFDAATAGMGEADRAAAQINRTFDDQRRQLDDLGASTADYLVLEMQRTEALQASTAAMQANIEGLLGDLAFDLNIDGLSAVELAQERVNRQYAGYRATLISQGATVEQLTQLEILHTEALEQATNAVQNAGVSVGEIFDRIGAFVADLDAQTAQFRTRGASAAQKFPDYQSWIESITGFNPRNAAAMVDLSDTRDTVSAAYARQIATLNMSIANAQQRLANTPWFAQADQMLLERQIAALRRTLAEVTGGFSDALDYVDQLFSEQLGDLLGGLRDEFGTNDPIADINERFDDLRDQAEAWGATAAELAEIEAFRAQALQQAIDDRYESEMAWLRDLIDFRDSLLLGDLSTLTPAEQFAEAQRQYNETLAAAQDGDATAQGNFRSVAESFLEAWRMFDPEGYNEGGFDQVLQQINDLIENNGAAQAGGTAGQGTAAAGEGPTPAAPPASAQFDVSPITTELVGLRSDVVAGNTAIVNQLITANSRIASLERATADTAAELRRANDDQFRR